MKKILFTLLFSSLFVAAYTYKDAYNDKSYKTAISMAESAAARGDLEAVENLCKMYLDIEEVKDYQKAAYYLLILENRKGDSVDINRYKGYFKNGGYSKNLELYIANLKNENARSKNSSQASQSGLMEAEQNLLEAKNQLNDYRSKCSQLERDLNNAQYEIQRLKNLQNQDSTKFSDFQRQNQKSINELNYEINAKNRQLQESEDRIGTLEHEKESLLKDFIALRNHYNELVNKYNSLLERCGSSSSKAETLPDDLTAKGNVANQNDGLTGFARGCYTLVMSPFNLFRAFSFSYADNPIIGLVELPFILAFETVPMTADLFNGTLDTITFGAYGDELYGDGTLTYDIFERDNKGFPWIDKEQKTL